MTIIQESDDVHIIEAERNGKSGRLCLENIKEGKVPIKYIHKIQKYAKRKNINIVSLTSLDFKTLIGVEGHIIN